MNPLVVLGVAVVCVFALKQYEDEGDIGWRMAAVCAGVVFPYVDMLLWAIGAGPALQLRYGVLWSVFLIPVYAFVLAVGVRAFYAKPLKSLFEACWFGMMLTVCLGMLTVYSVALFMPLSMARVGVGVVHSADIIIFGLAVFGCGMMMIFPQFSRDMARLTLGCMMVYVLIKAGLAWEAHRQGEVYAKTMRMAAFEVSVRPGFGSPFRWNIMVEERGNKLHVARMNVLDRASGPEATAKGVVYLPVNAAVWRVYSRFGEGDVLSDNERRHIRLAWYAWQDSAFAGYRYGRVFDGFAKASEMLDRRYYTNCVRFTDAYIGRWDWLMPRTIMVCPQIDADKPARFFGVRGDTMTELIPFFGVK